MVEECIELKKKSQWKEKLCTSGKPWYNKWWVILIIFLFVALLVALLVALPFIINYAYMIGLTLQEPNTAFSASDLLNLYGSILSLIGTVVLGTVSLVQNSRVTKLNEILMQDQRQAQLPIFSVQSSAGIEYEIKNTHWDIGSSYGSDIGFTMQDYDSPGHEIAHVIFSIKNISNFPVYGFKLTKCNIHTVGAVDFHTFTPVFDTPYGFGTDEVKSICITFVSQCNNFFGLDKNMVQITATFECKNPQKYVTELTLGLIIINGKCRTLGTEFRSEYKKFATNKKT